jgi:hypothetical protein
MAMELTSSAFVDGGTLPRAHGREGGDRSPPLQVTGLPDGTTSVALVADDPGAVATTGRARDHWLVWGLAPEDGTVSVPAGWDATAAGAVEGRNYRGGTGYAGPERDRDDARALRVRAYALDHVPSVSAGGTKADLVAAMQSHVLDTAECRATYG